MTLYPRRLARRRSLAEKGVTPTGTGTQLPPPRPTAKKPKAANSSAPPRD